MAAFNVSLPKLQIAIDRAWRDPIRNAQFVAHVDALRTQLERQTITMPNNITGSGKNAKQLTTTIYWLESCTNDTTSCSDECVVATGEATDNSQDVTLSCLREAGFKEGYKRQRVSPHSLEETIAFQMMLKMKALDEYLNSQYIAFLEANKGEHQYELPIGADNGGDWEIPASDWAAYGPALMGELQLAANLSQFTNPYMLDGQNFWIQRFIAQQNAANADGKGDNNLFNSMQWAVSDPIGMNNAGVGSKTYMINASAAAFVSGNFWDSVPKQMAGNHRVYKVASKNLPGIYYDVHEIEDCVSDDFILSIKMKAYGSFELNPLGCDTDVTGILAFEKVAGI